MASTHDPYVPASRTLAELTVGSVILGCVLGLVFAASSVYLALKVGLTVSASIPIAGGAILGGGIAALQALRRYDTIAITHWLGPGVTSITENALVAMAMCVLLPAIPLYRVARRKAA